MLFTVEKYDGVTKVKGEIGVYGYTDKPKIIVFDVYPPKDSLVSGFDAGGVNICAPGTLNASEAQNFIAVIYKALEVHSELSKEYFEKKKN